MGYHATALPILRRRRYGGGVAYSVLSLFAAGEQGVWLDNSDFTTLFQDAAGTTPVTGYEQFVGLRLDKSKGLVLGPELVANGNFATDTVWNKGTGWTISGGTANFSGTTGVNISQQLSGNLGSIYLFTFTVSTISGGSLRGFLGYSGAGHVFDVSTTGTYTYRLPLIGNQILTFQSSTGSTMTASIDNVSVKLLPGNHAYQTNINARAVLSARYNLLIDTAAMGANLFNSLSNITRGVGTGGTPSSGSGNYTRFTAVAGNTDHYAQTVGVSLVASVVYTVSFEVQYVDHRWIGISVFEGGFRNGCTFDLANGVTGSTLGLFTSRAITSLGNGRYRVTANYTAAATGVAYFSFVMLDSDKTFSTVTTSNLTATSVDATFADLRVANESSALPAYQRVGAAVNGTSTSIGTPDYDTVGFPAYLRYDGGDWYQTNSIDFSTGATNPPLGPELVTNGDFSAGGTGWTNASTGTGTASFTGGVATIVGTSSGNRGAISQAAGFVVGRFYRVTFTVVRTSGILYVMTAGVGGSGGLVISASGTYSFIHTAPSTSFVVFTDGSGASYTIDNISVKEIDQNYAPDKMSVFAGVRKLSDAAPGGVLETSTNAVSNAGTFWLFAPGSTGPIVAFDWMTRGATFGGRVTPAANLYPAPGTFILTGTGNISADIATLRVNGVDAGTGTQDQGSGNFGNYPLYIGSRGGTDFFFTGREYETIVLGRAVTATELANTEGYMEAQTFGKDMSYVYADELTTSLGDLITAADGDQIYMTVNYQ